MSTGVLYLERANKSSKHSKCNQCRHLNRIDYIEEYNKIMTMFYNIRRRRRNVFLPGINIAEETVEGFIKYAMLETQILHHTFYDKHNMF